ncbi:MAG TPA: phosphoglycerate kinase [Candidatus Paceibacterota bacterium]|nr:phosphoglycerate kinase [Candidatus Paceibacterota bacterium]
MLRFLSETGRKPPVGTALLRLDFNTEDDWRMRAVLPTIKFLLKTSPRIVIASHKGRPRGFEKELSLRKNAAALSRLLGRKVVFVPDFNFKKIKEDVAASPRGSIFLLENLRFEPGEEANSPRFARQLASLADFYVNDAFAVSHRANASVAAVAKLLPGYAGLELEREIRSLSRVMRNPKRPVVFIVGGAKAADKLDVLKFFRNRADWFLLGGGPANTVLALRGMDIKQSIRDTDPKNIPALKKFSHSRKVVVPVDFHWHGDRIWDIGPETAADFAKKLAAAGTILWSGPLGMIEKPAFAKGSIAVARAVTRNRRAFSVSGGGETVMFLRQYRFDRRFSFISTGGGAMIDFLAGRKLPGIAALER